MYCGTHCDSHPFRLLVHQSRRLAQNRFTLYVIIPFTQQESTWDVCFDVYKFALLQANTRPDAVSAWLVSGIVLLSYGVILYKIWLQETRRLFLLTECHNNTNCSITLTAKDFGKNRNRLSRIRDSLLKLQICLL